jgi:predicted ribosomally synthesized peptide with SipW-like signal peptide
VKKLLFGILAVVLSIGMMGSAFAYFTDIATTTNNVMSAGTLNIQISDNNEPLQEGPISASFNSPAGLAPGQSFNTNIVSIKNVGSINIAWVWARFGNLTESVPDMSKHLIMTHYWELDPIGPTAGVWADQLFDVETSNVFLNYWIGRGAGVGGMTADGSISLWDLIEANDHGSGDMFTSLLLMNNSPLAQSATGNLPVDSTVSLYFTFQLDPTTNNTFQGANASFQVDFIGSQYNGYPDSELFDYITQPYST